MLAAIVSESDTNSLMPQFAQGAQLAVAKAQRTLATLWPAAGTEVVQFVPPAQLPPLSRGEGCYAVDRRYLFPYLHHSGRQSAWSVRVSRDAPDDDAEGWCGWYWGHGGTYSMQYITTWHTYILTLHVMCILYTRKSFTQEYN